MKDYKNFIKLMNRFLQKYRTYAKFEFLKKQMCVESMPKSEARFKIIR